jgi:hypothetical protein
MNVVVGSIFRNSASYVGRYFQQVEALRRDLDHDGHHLRLSLVEGDSTDSTYRDLSDGIHAFPGSMLTKREHGQPEFGSVDRLDRWQALSWCCNGVLETLFPSDDAVIYVESDLIWDSFTMGALLAHLRYHPAVSPMCFTTSMHFYDTWGFVKDGECFGPFPPYHKAIGDTLTAIDSAGSCIVMRGEVARAVRFGPEDCVRGLGRSIYAHGYHLSVDPSLKVYHP